MLSIVINQAWISDLLFFTDKERRCEKPSCKGEGKEMKTALRFTDMGGVQVTLRALGG